MNNPNKKKQLGLTSVEFAICGVVYFMVLFGVIETGRFLFTLNALDEVTRRGARLASVCHPDDIDVVNTIARMNDNLIHGLTKDHISIGYLKSDYQPYTNFVDIAYVRVSVENYTHRLLIPFLTTDIPTPSFSTTSRAESLGVIPPTETTPAGLSTC